MLGYVGKHRSRCGNNRPMFKAQQNVQSQHTHLSCVVVNIVIRAGKEDVLGLEVCMGQLCVVEI